MRAEASSSSEEASAAQILSQQEDGRKLMEQEEGEEQDAEKRSECGPLITEELTDERTAVMESCQSLKLLVVCLMMTGKISAASQQVQSLIG